MKKKNVVLILGIILVALLVIPIPTGVYRDGGTREYTALTYKLVHWQRILPEDSVAHVYDRWRWYPFPLNFRSVEDLWASECETLPNYGEPAPNSFYATVLQVRDTSLLVDGLDTNSVNYRYEFSLFINPQTRIVSNGESVDLSSVKVNDVVLVSFEGPIRETYPAQVETVISIEILPRAAKDGSVPFAAQCHRVNGTGDGEELVAEVSENWIDPEFAEARRLPLVKIDSQSDWNRFLALITEENGFYPQQFGDFENAVASFDGAFFEEQTLFVLFASEGSGSIRHTVSDVSVSDSNLTVMVKPSSPEVGTCDMAGWLIFVSVPKDRVAGCASYDAFRVSDSQ